MLTADESGVGALARTSRINDQGRAFGAQPLQRGTEPALVGC